MYVSRIGTVVTKRKLNTFGMAMARQQFSFCCISNRYKIFVFSKESRQAVQLTQPPIQLASGIMQLDLLSLSLNSPQCRGQECVDLCFHLRHTPLWLVGE